MSENKTLKTEETNRKTSIRAVRFITLTAILGALSAVLQMFEFPVVFLVPSYIKFDFSDLPAILATFLVSPVSGVLVCLIKNLIHTATSNSAGVGELANFLTSACCVLPAGIIYKIKPTKLTAAISMGIGSVTSAVASIFINYYITYPFYMAAFGLDMDGILGTYEALSGNIVSLWDCLIWFNAPFTLLKFALCSIVVFFIYKPLSKAIKRYE